MYKEKGTVEAAHPISGVETATKVCSSEGDREENCKEKKEDYSGGDREEKSGGDREENREEKSGGDSEGINGDDERAPKGAGRNNTTKTMKKKKKMSPLQKEEPVGRIIISTLDRSAQV